MALKFMLSDQSREKSRRCVREDRPRKIDEISERENVRAGLVSLDRSTAPTGIRNAPGRA